MRRSFDEHFIADGNTLPTLLNCIKQVHISSLKRNLPIFGVEKPLKDYITKLSDSQRGISRMPFQSMRLRHEDLLDASECPEEEDKEEDALFDEFVIIEKDEARLEELNKPEVIEIEKKRKDEGRSSLIFARQPDESKELDVTLEDFQIKKVIDKGSFGKVFLVVNRKNGRQYAMKRIRKDILINKGQVQNTKNERDILLNIEHPFLLGMDYVFQNDFRLYFFLDYIKGGNLYDHLYKVRRFPEKIVQFFSAQIALALGYLHSRKIMHRDLKPENVLLHEDGYLCLADFGLAKFMQDSADQTYSFCGTAEYLAPEILRMKGHGMGVDWWTFGILVYEMTTGRPPFMDKNHHKLGMLIREGPIIFPDPVRHKIPMSDALKDLISRLLERDQDKRLGCQGRDFQEIREHAFFKDFDFDALESKQMESPYLPADDDPEDEPLDKAEPDLMPLRQAETIIDGKERFLIENNQNKFEGF